MASTNWTRPISINETDLVSGSVDNPLSANQQVSLELPLTMFNQIGITYLFMVNAVDEAGNAGIRSNIARFTNPAPRPTTTSDGLSTVAIVVIVIGSMVSAVAIAGLAFIFIKRRRSK